MAKMQRDNMRTSLLLCVQVSIDMQYDDIWSKNTQKTTSQGPRINCIPEIIHVLLLIVYGKQIEFYATVIR